MTVFTGTFWLLEGLGRDRETIVKLAVGFDKQEMIDFAILQAELHPEVFMAYRLTENGNILQLLGLPQPTHEAPIRPI